MKERDHPAKIKARNELTNMCDLYSTRYIPKKISPDSQGGSRQDPSTHGGTLMRIVSNVTGFIIALSILLPALWVSGTGSEGDYYSENPQNILDNGEFEMEILSTGSNSLRVELYFGAPIVNEVYLDGSPYSVLSFEGSAPIGSVGRPMLPSINIPLAVQEESASVDHTIGSSIIIHADSILPLQEANPDIVGEETGPFVVDEEFYNSPTKYPTDILEAESGRIADLPFKMITLTPAQFTGANHEIRWITKMSLDISWRAMDTVTIDSGSPFLDMFPRIFRNWNSFRYTLSQPIDGGSGCDYVIITHPSLLNASVKLAKWKNQLGMETHVYDLDQIGHNREEILEFVKYTYENFNPRPYFFLFMGDSDLLPTNYVNGHDYDRYLTGTDLYYATVSGSDYYPDLFNGRIPANNESEANMIVDKIIKYEKDPPRHKGFYENVTLAAYFQDRNRDTYADRRFAQTSEETYDFMNSLGYDSSRIYFTESYVNPLYWNQGTYSNGEPIPTELLKSNGFAWDGSKQDIIDAFHNGSFLITHRDHGGTDGWGEPSFRSSDIINLKNGDLLPVVFSINCLTGYFDNETSIGPYAPSEESFAEHLLNQEGGGAVGVVSATRVSYSGYNDYFYKGLYDAMYPSLNSNLGNSTPIYTLSVALNYAKYYMASTWGDAWGLQSLEYELFHYLGDPTMELWTSEPKDIHASHHSYLPMGTTMVQVNTSVENATVCISYNGTILGLGTVENGSANISVEKLQPGNITVTITKHDYRPYISEIQVNATECDLRIASIDVNSSGEAGEKWAVEGRVNNIGNSDLSSINVTLLLDSVALNTTRIVSLGAGNSVDISLNFTPVDDSWHTLGLQVENKSENVTWNNLNQQMIMVHGDPDMYVNPAGSMDIWWRTGEEQTFNISIDNRDHGKLTYELEDRTLLSEGFSNRTLNTDKWMSGSHSLGIGTNGLYPPSYPYSMDLRCGENLTSSVIDTSNYSDLKISYYLERGGFNYLDESVDYIHFEYLSDQMNWVRLKTDNGDFFQSGFFSQIGIDLPSDACHSDFRFRFLAENTYDYFGNGPGVFQLDDIKLTHGTTNYWLNASNVSGSIKYGGRGNISITVNCTTLAVGNYSSLITLLSNDEDGYHGIPLNLEVRENITPIADAGSDIVIDQHEVVFFNGSGSADNVGVTNWTWTFNDGDLNRTLYGPMPNHTFHNAGSFQVLLTVRDHAWNLDSDLFNVTVLDITDPVADAGGDLTVDQHTKVVLNGSGSSDNVGITNWNWTIQTESDNRYLEGNMVSYTFHDAGQFQVNLTVKDAMNNSDFDIIIVTVNDTTKPYLDVIPDIHADQYEEFHLNGSKASDNIEVVNWTWEIQLDEGYALLYGEELIHAIDEAGNYSASLNVTDESGNYNSTTFMINIRDITPPDPGDWSGMRIPQGEDIVLNGSCCSDNVGIVNWTWHLSYNGNNITLFGPLNILNASEAGICDVILEVRDGSGNVANTTFNIIIDDTEDPIASIEGERTIKQHERLILSGTSSTDNVGIVAFTWEIPELETWRIFGEELNITIDDAGIYNVTLTAEDMMGNNDSVTIRVFVIDITSPTVEVGPDMDVFVNDTIILDVVSSSDNIGITSYRWSVRIGDSNITLNGSQAELIVNKVGEWEARLTVSDSEGNTAMDSLIIRVSEREKNETDQEPTDDDNETGEQPGDDTGDEVPEEEEDDDDGISIWLILTPIVVILLLILLGIILLLAGNKREKEEIMSWDEE